MLRLLPNILLSAHYSFLGCGMSNRKQIPVKSVFNTIIFMQISVSILLVEPKNCVYPLGMFHSNRLFLAQMTTQTCCPNGTLLSDS